MDPRSAHSYAPSCVLDAKKEDPRRMSAVHVTPRTSNFSSQFVSRLPPHRTRISSRSFTKCFSTSLQQSRTTMSSASTASMQFAPEWLKPGRKQPTKQPSFSSLGMPKEQVMVWVIYEWLMALFVPCQRMNPRAKEAQTTSLIPPRLRIRRFSQAAHCQLKRR